MGVNGTTLVYSSVETDYTFTDSTIVTDNVILQTGDTIGATVTSVYASVIGSILGFFLLAAVVCWLVEQSERVSDPIGENIRNILNKPRREIPEWSETSSAVTPPDDAGFPGRPKPTSNAFEMQESDPNNLYDEACGDNLYESYDESAHRELRRSRRSYGYINPIATAETRIRSVSVKSMADQRNNPLVQEMKIKFQSNDAPGSTRRPSGRPHAYQARIDLIEDAYNESIYSNDEIPPEIPSRDPK